MSDEYQLLIQPRFRQKLLFREHDRPAKEKKSFTLYLDVTNTGATLFEGGSIYNINLYKPGESEPQCLDKGGPALSIPKMVQGEKTSIEIGLFRIIQAGPARIEATVNALLPKRLVLCRIDDRGKPVEVRTSRSSWEYCFEVLEDKNLQWAIFWVAALTLILTAVGVVLQYSRE